VKEREALYRGAELDPYAAVLHSSRHAKHPVDFYNPIQTSRVQTSLRGCCRLLNESMIPFQYINEKKLLNKLKHYKVLIVVDQPYLSAELADRLRAWVADGGVLICAGKTGMLDPSGQDRGKFVLEDLLGVQYAGMYEQSHAYIEVFDDFLKRNALDMPHMTEGEFTLVKPGPHVEILANLRGIYLRSDGKHLLKWSPPGESTGHPAITLNRVGKGYASYIACDIFYAFQQRNQWNLKHIVSNLIDRTLAVKPITVESDAWVEVVTARQSLPGGGKRRLVHLVNWHGSRPVDGNPVLLEQLVPVHGITAIIAHGKEPSEVRLEPQGVVPEWTYEDGKITVRIDKLDIQTAIAIYG
jgi:hypothetical protein